MIRFAFVAVLISAALVSSCKDAPTEYPEHSRSEDRYPFFLSPAGNQVAWLSTRKHTEKFQDGDITESLAEVFLFHPDSAASIDGGTVSYNGVTLTRRDHSPDGVYYANSTNASQAVPLSWSSSSNVFSVSGSTAFAALADTIASPGAEVSVSAPTVTDSLSKAAGFSVSWNNGGAIGDTIVISVDDGSNGFNVITADDGSEFISSSMLSALVANHALRVTVTRVRYEISTDGQRSWCIAAYSTVGVNTWLGS